MPSSKDSTSSAFGPNGFVFYHYEPSLAAAIVFAILFGISTVIHLFQIFRQKTWFFIALAIGGIFETIGYIGRALSSQDPTSLTPYIIQSILLLVAPALFAASIYMVLGRLIVTVHGEHLSPVPVRWLTKMFVTGDVFSFLLQSSGGGLQAQGTQSAVELGRNLVIGGLAVQLLFFGGFVVAASVFHWRFGRYGVAVGRFHWRRHLIALYISSALILIRSIYRVVEYSQGYDGYLFHYEVFVYVLDATLMLLVMVVFNLIHFSPAQLSLSEKNQIPMA